jgi:hypothetical protein
MIRLFAKRVWLSTLISAAAIAINVNMAVSSLPGTWINALLAGAIGGVLLCLWIVAWELSSTGSEGSEP